MSRSGDRIDDGEKRSSGRRQVALSAALVTIDGATSVLVEDLCPKGARLCGRKLPSTGEEILLRASEMTALGHIISARAAITAEWRSSKVKGIGLCLSLQMRNTA
jgi:hypothetical protein